MKKLTFILYAALLPFISMGQKEIQQNVVRRPPEDPSSFFKLLPDTTPVWVIYLDSVRVFAAYPDQRMTLDVEAGWRVRRLVKSPYDVEVIDQYFNCDGKAFNIDMVVESKPRRIIPNLFRQ